MFAVETSMFCVKDIKMICVGSTQFWYDDL